MERAGGFGSVASTRDASPRGRVPLYDVLRVFAILCVMLCHCVELAFAPSGSLSFSLLHFLGRLGVPVFFFLTGALVMSKSFDSPEKVSRFYRHNLLGLLVTAEVWVALYCLWMSLNGGAGITLGSYLRYALFLEAVPLAHWWYVPTILSIYVVVPLVALGIRSLNGDGDRVHPAIQVVLGFSVLINFVIPTFNRYAPLLGLSGVGTQFVGSVFGPYLTYILVGLLILRGKVLQKVPAAMLAILAALSSACAVLEGWLAGDLWYDSLFLLAASGAIVELSRRSITGLPKSLASVMGLLSRCSFGVFLAHLPVRDLVAPWLAASPGLVSAALLFLVVTVLSFAVVLLVWFATARVGWLRRAVLDA